MELYRRARGALPSVFTFIRTVDQKLIEILIIENFQKNLYIFCLKVAVWILPEARVQTVGTR